MKFWRKRRTVDTEWLWVNRSLAYEMADEMATWPEPIDVIRRAMGLTDRWQTAMIRAWHEVLALIVGQMPFVAATEADAARMARLMIASPTLNRLEVSWRTPKRYRR